MADGIRKIDEKELVRAHVYTLLGGQEGGVLATRKEGIAYPHILEYAMKQVGIDPMKTIHRLYTQTEDKEEFEKSVYGILFMYGLGRVGYTELAKLLAKSGNASDFVANAEESIASAEKKADTRVAYPAYPMQLPEMRITGRIPEKPATRTASAEGTATDAGTVPVNNNELVDFTREFGMKMLKTIQAQASRDSGLQNLTVEKVRAGLITADADGTVRISENVPGGKMYYLEHYGNTNDKNEHFIKITRWDEDKAKRDYETYSLKKVGNGYRLDLITAPREPMPLDIMLNVAEKERGWGFTISPEATLMAMRKPRKAPERFAEAPESAVSTRKTSPEKGRAEMLRMETAYAPPEPKAAPFGKAPEPVDCTRLFALKLVENITVTPTAASGLENLTAKMPPFGKLNPDAASSVFISGEASGKTRTYYLEYHQNPNQHNEYFVKITDTTEPDAKGHYDYATYSLRRQGNEFQMEQVTKSAAPMPFDISITAGKGRNQVAFDINNTEVTRVAIGAGEKRRLPG